MKFSVAYVLAVSVLYVSSFPIVLGKISSNLGVNRNLLLRSSPSFFAAKKSNGLIDIRQSQKFRLLEDVSSFDWNQIGNDIDGEAAFVESGYSVSLSADGMTVAIGAIYNDNDNGQDSGHVRVFSRPNDDSGDWNQIGKDIDGEAANDESGGSVSLSADGKTLAIGAFYNGGYAGHVRVFSATVSSDAPSAVPTPMSTTSPIPTDTPKTNCDGDCDEDSDAPSAVPPISMPTTSPASGIGVLFSVLLTGAMVIYNLIA